MTAVLWVAALIAMAGASVLLGTSARVMVQRHRVQQQLALIARHAPARSTGDDTDLLRPQQAPTVWTRLVALFPRLVQSGATLQQAGLAWSVQRYALYRVAAAGAAGVLVLAAGRGAWLAVAAAMAGSLLPVLHVRRRRSRRLASFEEQLSGAIDLMARALRAGHPLVYGLKLVGEDSPEPLATEFRIAFEEHRFGMPLDEAMSRLADRLQLTDARILMTAIMVQRDAGGNIAEVFSRLAQLMRERSVLRRQVRIHTAQGRMSGYLLSALPLAVGLLLLAFNPDYVMILVRDPVGRILLGASATLQVLGHFWIQRIVRIDV